MGCLRPKYVIFELTKYRGVTLMALKIDGKFEGKLTSASKNDMRNSEHSKVSKLGI